MIAGQRFSVMTLVQSSLFLLLFVLLVLFEDGGSFWTRGLVFIGLIGWHFSCEGRISVPERPGSRRYGDIFIYLVICTLLVWLTRGEEESPLWIVYFLPIILAASVLPLKQTLWTCIAALILFISHLPLPMFVNEDLRSEVLPELLGFGIMFFLVGTLVQDFAQRHRRQLAQLEQAEKTLRARERLASLGELSAGIAHEIRNPLGIISSSAQMLETKSISEQDRVLLDIIQEEATRLNGLISDFLFFGRQLEPQLELCELDGLLTRQIEALQATASQRGVELTLRIVKPGCRALIDAGMIQQVVLNLILNALDATPSGGRVDVRLDGGADGLKLSVRDTGCGIPVADLKRIFDPFFTTKGSGTGLGLANSYKIIHSHGGDIQVESRPGAGTVMLVTLPLGGN